MEIFHNYGEEWVPLVDESGRVTGKVPRSQVHNGSFLLHPVVHLHVIGPGNTLLLQKRPLHKDIQPGKWDTAVGGHISFGESPLEALAREAEEETGLKTFTPQLVRTYIWTSDVEREFVHLHVTREYVSTDIHLHPETRCFPSPDPRQSLEPEPDCDTGLEAPELAEVEALRFWKVEEILTSLGEGIFTPNFEHDFQLLLKEGFFDKKNVTSSSRNKIS